MRVTKYQYSEEPEKIRAWRKYAYSFNQHLIDRTRYSVRLDNSIKTEIIDGKRKGIRTLPPDGDIGTGFNRTGGRAGV